MIFEFELASLDVGNTSVSSENQIKGATAESDLLIGPTEQFQANFDQVFGSNQLAATENEWNQFLPSHILSNNLLGESPQSPAMTAASASFHSIIPTESTNSKKAENVSKKVRY